MDGLFHGKCENKMDDYWWFRGTTILANFHIPSYLPSHIQWRISTFQQGPQAASSAWWQTVNRQQGLYLMAVVAVPGFFWPIAMPGFLTHRHIWKSEKWPHPISRTTGFIFGAKPRIPRVVWTFPRWASRDRREGRDYGPVDFPQHLLWVGYIRMLVLFVDFGAAVYPFSISISLDDIPVHWQVSKIVHEDGHCRFNIISCTTFSFSSAHWSD